nr:replication factor A protein 1-like [Ipomoea batatas]
MELIGIGAAELYNKHNHTNQPPKEIKDLVGRSMLFKISAKKGQFVNLHNAFPVLRINNDQQVVAHHYPELLNAQDKDLNSDLHLSEGDDDFLEGFLSDEADNPIANLAATNTGNATNGAVKRCLLDEFSSTQGSKNVKETSVKLEKLDYLCGEDILKEHLMT